MVGRLAPSHTGRTNSFLDGSELGTATMDDLEPASHYDAGGIKRWLTKRVHDRLRVFVPEEQTVRK